MECIQAKDKRNQLQEWQAYSVESGGGKRGGYRGRRERRGGAGRAGKFTTPPGVRICIYKAPKNFILFFLTVVMHLW